MIMNELKLDVIATRILADWDVQQDYRLNLHLKEMAEWRLRTFNILKKLDNPEREYILRYLETNAPAKLYVDINDVMSRYKVERYDKSLTKMIYDIFTKISRIKLKQSEGVKINGKEICSNSKIFIGRDSNDNTPTRSDRGSK